MERMKVLVAIDASATANRALHFALQRCLRSHDEITVLSVLDVRQVTLMVRTNPRAAAASPSQAEGLASLLQQAAGTAGGYGVGVHTQMAASPDPAAEIVRVARDGGFDEIVLGHREKKGLEKVVLGSTALRVLELTEIPVTIVR
jgi:nucleotide-binding universal stress UspA family protein